MPFYNKKIGILAVPATLLCIFLAYKFWVPRRPNVILIMLDTLRADHLGFYGYERNTSKFLDKFAAQNIAYSYAISPAPWTPPCVSSLFTGKYAATHGLVPPNSRKAAKEGGRKLSSSLRTIAEILKEDGFQTYAVSPNPWITENFGFAQGFDTFLYKNRANASVIGSTAEKFVESSMSDRSKPFFLYLHYLDVHDPYEPPPEFAGLYQQTPVSREYDEKSLKLLNLYDAEINYLDSELEKLFAYFKKRGVYENSMIVIVADHGEQFMEHGFYEHGNQLYNEEVHVPLFIKPPYSGNAKRVEETVSVVDVLPTILDVLKIKRPHDLQGVSLLNDEEIKGREGVFSEISRRLSQRAFVTLDGRKVIAELPLEKKDFLADYSQASFTFFDRHNDPFDKNPLRDIASASDLKKSLQQILADVLEQAENKPQAEDAKIDDKVIHQLESLGYLK